MNPEQKPETTEADPEPQAPKRTEAEDAEYRIRSCFLRYWSQAVVPQKTPMFLAWWD